MSPQRIRAIQSGAAGDLAARLLRAGTSGVSSIYSIVVDRRNRQFELDGKKSHRIDRKVISVGNLTAGGTGKTPVVAWLARRLFALGEKPAILTRGYKSRGGTSDEAQLLESELKQLDPNSPASPIPIGVDPDRIKKARSLLESNPEITVFILDDGFQHRKLARDFDLVLIDATNPFGFDQLLPRGMLRESVDGLKRAHAVLITRSNQVDRSMIDSIKDRVQSIASIPIYQSNHELDGLKRGNAQESIELIRGEKVAAFCGIGNPDAFFDLLERSGAKLVMKRALADHHAYTESDIDDLRKQADQSGAKRIITTAKDGIKLKDIHDVWIVELGLRFEAGDDEKLIRLIQQSIHDRP